MKKLLLTLAMLAIASVSHAAGYTSVKKPQPQLTDDSRIEVEAVFWYGCPYCYALEPHVQKMKKSMPDDVEFFHIPAPLSPAWAVHARAHHVAKELGIIDRVHQPIFDLLNKSHGRGLTELSQLAEFFARYGVEPKDTIAMGDDPRVMNQLRADHERLSAYGLREVPALIIDGKYMITPRTAGGLNQMITEAQALIEKVRKEKGAES